ncbi:MAG: hypothetical protein ACHQRM_17285 [Bacteroidia bacterium]
MLDENPVNQLAICDALIYIHRSATGVLPVGVAAPAGFPVGAAGLVTINYGYAGVQHGSIQITRGQFAVTGVTNAGVMAPLINYNHAGSSISLQDYINALKCTNLNANQTYVSALITLTSESCRSAMVSGAMQAILSNHGNFSADVWAGLNFAFTTYSQTATFKGYNIHAGGTPWTWLKSDDYKAYINSAGYGGDKTVATKIAAVQAYINAAV